MGSRARLPASNSRNTSLPLVDAPIETGTATQEVGKVRMSWHTSDERVDTVKIRSKVSKTEPL